MTFAGPAGAGLRPDDQGSEFVEGEHPLRKLAAHVFDPGQLRLAVGIVGFFPRLGSLERDRESLAGLSNPKLFRACAQLDPGALVGPRAAAAYTLRLLAHRIAALSAEITDLERRITDAINAPTPALLHQQGVGPDVAATLLLTAGDNPDRLTTEAGFAALCGVNPIDMSSGKTRRRRLNRGGDRQANSALYTVALSRLRWDQRTRDYVDRRTAEGKTRREAIRCLKRYTARDLYQLIAPAAPTPA